MATTVQDETVLAGVVPGDVPLEEAAPGGGALEEAVSGGVTLDGVVSGGVTLDEVVSGGGALDEVVSSGVALDGVVSGGVALLVEGGPQVEAPVARARRRTDRSAVARLVGDPESGMSTAEYAVGTVAACAFAAVLYQVVTGGSVVTALGKLVATALATLS